MLDTYAVIAEPGRRRILDRLLRSSSSVNELAIDLGMSQPLVSKHLRTLRESGLVRFQTKAQCRIYYLNAKPLAEIDTWLSAYRREWNQRIDALAEHLDGQKNSREENTK